MKKDVNTWWVSTNDPYNARPADPGLFVVEVFNGHGSDSYPSIAFWNRSEWSFLDPESHEAKHHWHPNALVLSVIVRIPDHYIKKIKESP